MNEQRMPESTVTEFIRAMHEWEVNADDASRRARGSPQAASYLDEVSAACDRVFAEFCTARERPHRRQASFSRPPEYNPQTERIVASSVDGAKAQVDTHREAVLGAGLYRYLLRCQHGKWLIDRVKHEQDGQWQNHIL